MSIVKNSWLRGALAPSALSAAVLVAGGCAPGGAVDEDPTESAAYAALDGAEGVDAAIPDGNLGAAGGYALGGMGGGMGGMAGGLGGGMARLCDPDPQVTTVDVCGRAFVSSAHFAWTDCALRRGTSTGTIDLGATVTADDPASCSAATVFTFERQATFDVSRTRPDGATMQVSGTASSTEAHTLPPSTFTRSTTLDATRVLRDASGTLIRSVHVTGTITVGLDASTLPPTRTSNGTLAVDFADGTTGTVELRDVVRPSPFVCRFPISGTVVRTMADGTVHTLVYGPTCGQATLDGNAIDPQRRRGGGGQGFCMGG